MSLIGRAKRLAKRALLRVESRTLRPQEHSGPANAATKPRDTSPRDTSQHPRDTSASLGDPSQLVQIYGRRSCSFCARARRLMDEQGLAYQYVSLDGVHDSGVLAALQRETQQGTVPYVFVRGRFIGGFEQLRQMVGLGQFHETHSSTIEGLPILNDESSQPLPRGIRLKIELAPR